jgi:hypothetical protein
MPLGRVGNRPPAQRICTKPIRTEAEVPPRPDDPEARERPKPRTRRALDAPDALPKEFITESAKMRRTGRWGALSGHAEDEGRAALHLRRTPRAVTKKAHGSTPDQSREKPACNEWFADVQPASAYSPSRSALPND